MKVLFITHCTNMAGANRSMFQLILELRNNYGVVPYVLLPLSLSTQHTLKSNLDRENIAYEEYNIKCFMIQKKTHEIRYSFVYNLNNLQSLCEKLKPMQFDIVHSNSSVTDYGGYISSALGIRHVWHLREFGDLDYNLQSLWGSFYKQETYKNADKFIAISEKIKEHFLNIIPNEKIQIIYNGIKPKDEVPLSRHENKIVQFLCAGLICESKNQLEIIKAINILVNIRKIVDFHLTIVGSYVDDYLEKLHHFIRDNHLEEFVTFKNEVDGIESLASSMDVGVMSSTCEAFGRVTVEYMLQNLAVIVNDKGANPEIVNDGYSGLIYRQGDIVDLANKMQQLVYDRDRLLKFAANGYKNARLNFLSNKNSQQIYDLYVEVLSAPSIPSKPIYSLYSYKIIKLVFSIDRLASKVDHFFMKVRKYYRLFLV